MGEASFRRRGFGLLIVVGSWTWWNLDPTLAAKERVGDSMRRKIDIDAVVMDLRSDDERSKPIEGFSSAVRGDRTDGVGRGGERAFDRGRVATFGRQRSRGPCHTNDDSSRLRP